MVNSNEVLDRYKNTNNFGDVWKIEHRFYLVKEK